MVRRERQERWLFGFTVRLLNQSGVLACKKVSWDGMDRTV